MFNKKTIRDVNFKGQTVLLRADYNVPLHEDTITDDLRIRASLPTIEYLRMNGVGKIVIISHLGRPEGQKVKAFSLKIVADRLKQLMPKGQVEFVDDISGPEVEKAVEKLPKGGVLLLENLRFNPGEEKNSEDFAREIVDSTHAELFIQDGFAVVHRAHTSTDAIAKILPSVAGLLVEKEISTLSGILSKPKHPLLVIIGGSKVADKQPLIDNFLHLADKIIVGGKIAADGYTSTAPKIYVAEDFDTDATGAKLDVGPVSTAKMVEEIEKSETIIWNGVLGKTEDPAYATSSTIVAQAIGKKEGITSAICGGDTSGFVENLQKIHPDLAFTLVSTGGGASLELLSGLKLPGVEALEDK